MKRPGNTVKESGQLPHLWNVETARTDLSLNVIIENAPVGILVTDPRGRIVLANSAIGELLCQQLPAGKDLSTFANLHLRYPDGTAYAARDQPCMVQIFHPISFQDRLANISAK